MSGFPGFRSDASCAPLLSGEISGTIAGVPVHMIMSFDRLKSREETVALLDDITFFALVENSGMTVVCAQSLRGRVYKDMELYSLTTSCEASTCRHQSIYHIQIITNTTCLSTLSTLHSGTSSTTSPTK